MPSPSFFSRGDKGSRPRANRSSGSASYLYVAPSGSDANDGTFERPYKTIQHAANLADNTWVLVRGGQYPGDVKVTRSGVNVLSYNNEPVLLKGRLWVTSTAHHFGFSAAYHDGRNANHLPSPTVHAPDCTFTSLGVTNGHTGIAFNLGGALYGRADRCVIRRCTIQRVGRLPAGNHDHGIYAEACSNIVVDTVALIECADRGLNLYYDCQDGTFTNLLIGACGEGVLFSGAGPLDEPGLSVPVRSCGNTITDSTIVGSLVRNNVESWYPSAVKPGTGNLIKRTTIGGGARALDHGIDSSAGGFTIDPSCILV